MRRWAWLWLSLWAAAASAMPPPALPDKRDVFVSRGWGAGGMPYNVLYLPPAEPQLMPQPMPQPMLQPMPQPQGGPQQLMSQVLARSDGEYEEYGDYGDYGEEEDEYGGADVPEMGGEEASFPQTAAYRAPQRQQQQQYNAGEMMQQPLPVKQYPVIPQLFVSYGWGPLGK